MLLSLKKEKELSDPNGRFQSKDMRLDPNYLFCQGALPPNKRFLTLEERTSISRTGYICGTQPLVYISPRRNALSYGRFIPRKGRGQKHPHYIFQTSNYITFLGRIYSCWRIRHSDLKYATYISKTHWFPRERLHSRALITERSYRSKSVALKQNSATLVYFRTRVTALSLAKWL